MKILKFILLIPCIALISCFSSKKLIAESKNVPSEFSAKKINGIYKNRIRNNDKIGFWNILANNKTFERDTTLISENSLVKLELISTTELKASLIENDLLVKSIDFNGKIVDDYFSIKKKLLFIPIPVIFYVHKERKTIIGNASNGNLILTKASRNYGWALLIFGINSGEINSYEIERVKN